MASGYGDRARIMYRIRAMSDRPVLSDSSALEFITDWGGRNRFPV